MSTSVSVQEDDHYVEECAMKGSGNKQDEPATKRQKVDEVQEPSTTVMQLTTQAQSVTTTTPAATTDDHLSSTTDDIGTNSIEQTANEQPGVEPVIEYVGEPETTAGVETAVEAPGAGSSDEYALPTLVPAPVPPPRPAFSYRSEAAQQQQYQASAHSAHTYDYTDEGEFALERALAAIGQSSEEVVKPPLEEPSVEELSNMDPVAMYHELELGFNLRRFEEGGSHLLSDPPSVEYSENGATLQSELFELGQGSFAEPEPPLAVETPAVVPGGSGDGCASEQVVAPVIPARLLEAEAPSALDQPNPSAHPLETENLSAQDKAGPSILLEVKAPLALDLPSPMAHPLETEAQSALDEPGPSILLEAEAPSALDQPSPSAHPLETEALSAHPQKTEALSAPDEPSPSIHLEAEAPSAFDQPDPTRLMEAEASSALDQSGPSTRLLEAEVSLAQDLPGPSTRFLEAVAPSAQDLPGPSTRFLEAEAPSAQDMPGPSRPRAHAVQLYPRGGEGEPQTCYITNLPKLAFESTFFDDGGSRTEPMPLQARPVPSVDQPAEMLAALLGAPGDAEEDVPKSPKKPQQAHNKENQSDTISEALRSAADFLSTIVFDNTPKTPASAEPEGEPVASTSNSAKKATKDDKKPAASAEVALCEDSDDEPLSEVLKKIKQIPVADTAATAVMSVPATVEVTPTENNVTGSVAVAPAEENETAPQAVIPDKEGESASVPAESNEPAAVTVTPTECAKPVASAASKPPKNSSKKGKRKRATTASTATSAPKAKQPKTTRPAKARTTKARTTKARTASMELRSHKYF